MELRSLAEIERDERNAALNPPKPPKPRKPPKPASLRPSFIREALYVIGRLIAGIPKLVKFLFIHGLALAILLGIVGIIAFGFGYLFK